MKYLDGEMSGSERTEFERHLEGCEECRSALRDFQELDTVAGRMRIMDPTDKFWDSYWKSIYHRLERKTAWVLFITGLLMILGYGIYKTVVSFKGLTFENVAAALVLIGGILLLVSIIRERMHQYKSDPYKDIKR